jgi:hypothetical protein
MHVFMARRLVRCLVRCLVRRLERGLVLVRLLSLLDVTLASFSIDLLPDLGRVLQAIL